MSIRSKTLESRINRKVDVRFGGGPSEKGCKQRHLAGGLPYLVEQWPAEITAVVPMAQVVEVRNIRELTAYAQSFQRLEPGTLSVAVISSEMLKRGSGWTPAVVRLPRRLKKVDAKGRPVFGAVEEALDHYDQASSDTDKARWRAEAEKQLDQTGYAVSQHEGEDWPTAVRRLIAEQARADLFACPRCGNVIYEKDERGRQLIPITDAAYFAGRKLQCSALVKKRVKRTKPNGHLEWIEREQPCAEPLYQMWRGQFSNESVNDTPAYPLADYIRRRMHHWVELAVFDECHLLKAQASDRGHAFGTLAATAKRTVGMTATLFGGVGASR